MLEPDYFTDDTPAPVVFELGEVRALVARLRVSLPCSGRCGNPTCEVMGYRGTVAEEKLIEVLMDVGTGDSPTARDLRATGKASLDQWRASLVERELL